MTHMYYLYEEEPVCRYTLIW